MATPERKYVSLDNPTNRSLAKTDHELFLQRFSPPITIDEVQYAPELFDYIKIYVDEHKGCGDFWLTGSQAFHVMKKVTESLAGRVGVVRMLGLSNSEINGRHFSAFEVDPPALIKRLDVAPRMYFLDTGLCAYLTRWNSAAALESGAMDGSFFETWVVSEIYKSYLNNGKRPPLFFYRDSNKKEIDLIIHQNNTVYPIKIKKGSAPKDAIKNFSVLNPIRVAPSEEDVFSGAAHLKTEIGTFLRKILRQTEHLLDWLFISRQNNR